jgi:hypothetical protein
MTTFRNASVWIDGVKCWMQATCDWTINAAGELVHNDSDKTERSSGPITGGLTVEGAEPIAGSDINFTGLLLSRRACKLQMSPVGGKILSHNHAFMTKYTAKSDVSKGTTTVSAEFEFGVTKTTG